MSPLSPAPSVLSHSKEGVSQKLPYSGILQEGPSAVREVREDTRLCSSCTGAAELQLSREKENWWVVSLLLWRVFISPAYVWTLLCADKTEAQRALCRHRCTGSHTEKAIVWPLTVPLPGASPHPQIWSSPNPYEVTAASKADFQAAQRHPGPSPQSGLPRSPQSKYRERLMWNSEP